MKNFTSIFLVIFILGISACNSNKITDTQTVDEKILWVNSSKKTCQGVGPMTCLQIQEGAEIEEGEWKNFFGNIEGFDYKPGSIYRIKVKVEKLPPPIPADASSLKYTLVEIISEEQDMSLGITDIYKVIKIGPLENPKGMDKDLFIEFNSSQRSVFAFSGCNTIRGGIAKITETEIEFGNLASTMMACPQEAMLIERAVTNAMEKTRRYTKENTRLVLKDAEDKELMILKKVD
jgi:heat shock protein HslJ